LEQKMLRASYKIVRVDEGWGVDHDGSVAGNYVTKEAAFEAAVGAASNAVRDGMDVTINVPGSQAGEPSLGKT
jgi:hypothetical protein